MICKKCSKKMEKLGDAPADITEKKCKACKKDFKTRWLSICPKCQHLNEYCMVCGKKQGEL